MAPSYLSVLNAHQVPLMQGLSSPVPVIVCVIRAHPSEFILTCVLMEGFPDLHLSTECLPPANQFSDILYFSLLVPCTL